MHVAMLRVTYLRRLVSLAGPLYLAFATPTCSGEIIISYLNIIKYTIANMMNLMYNICMVKLKR